MTFSQVKDILERARNYHHRLAGYYRGVKNATHRESVQFLAAYLAEQQDFLKLQLRLFSESDAPSANDSWIQYAPVYDLERVINELRVRCIMDPEELLDIGVELNRRLIKFYGRMSAMAPTAGLKSLFSMMERHQLEGQKNLANSGQRA